RFVPAPAEPEAAGTAGAAERRDGARYGRRVPPRRLDVRAEPAAVGDRALHGVVRGPVRPVGPHEAALEAVEIGLVHEVEEVERRHGRVTLDEADEVAVDTRLHGLGHRLRVLAAGVRALLARRDRRLPARLVE